MASIDMHTSFQVGLIFTTQNAPSWASSTRLENKCSAKVIRRNNKDWNQTFFGLCWQTNFSLINLSQIITQMTFTWLWNRDAWANSGFIAPPSTSCLWLLRSFWSRPSTAGHAVQGHKLPLRLYVTCTEIKSQFCCVYSYSCSCSCCLK